MHVTGTTSFAAEGYRIDKNGVETVITKKRIAPVALKPGPDKMAYVPLATHTICRGLIKLDT